MHNEASSHTNHSSIKYPHRLAHRPVYCGHCFSWSSFFSNDSSLCQVRQKLPSSVYPLSTWHSNVWLLTHSVSFLIAKISFNSELSSFSSPKFQNPSTILFKTWSGLSQQFCSHEPGTNFCLSWVEKVRISPEPKADSALIINAILSLFTFRSLIWCALHYRVGILGEGCQTILYRNFGIGRTKEFIFNLMSSIDSSLVSLLLNNWLHIFFL